MRPLLAITLAALLPACPPDDTCGPGNAAGDGLTLTGGGVSLRYHMGTASTNNDCPVNPPIEGVVPLTISFVQVGGVGDAINFCVPRPDMLADPMPLVSPPISPTPHGAQIEVVDVNATSAGCMFTRNTTTPPSGTANAEGICTNGTDPAGFALVVSGQVSVDRDCGGTIDTLRLDLAGVTSVATP